MNKFFMPGLLLSGLLWAQKPSLEGTYSKTPAVIDGKLNEKAWETAPTYSDFTVMSSKNPAKRKTELRILYTDTSVIFGFKASIPPDLLPTEEEAHQVNIFRTDCVEIMLDPSGGSDSYFHFIVNSVNMRFQRSCEQGGYVGNTHWKADWQSATARNADGWTAEIEVPYRSLELTGRRARFWSFNAVRESYRMPDNHPEVSSMADMGITHTAEAFRKLLAPDLDLSSFQWQIGKPNLQQKIIAGQLQVIIESRISNLTSQQKEIRLEATLTGADGFLAQSERIVTMIKDQTQMATFPPMMLPETGTYQGSITVRDRQQNRILNRKKFNSKFTFSAMEITLIDPHYRQAIFATQQLKNIRYQVSIRQHLNHTENLHLHSGIRAAGAGAILCQKTVTPQQMNEFIFDNASIPEGNWEIFAQLEGTEKNSQNTATTGLRKLPYKKNEVWRGKDDNWYVDGKKFFLLSSWGSGEVSRSSDYSVIFKSASDTRPMMFFNQKTGFGFSTAFRDRMKREGATPEVLNEYRERVRAAKNDPLLFAHYLIDEPDCGGFTNTIFASIAAAIAEEDPWHPIVISTGSAGLLEYFDCGEINGFHCYPRPVPGQPMSNFKKIVALMDKWRNHLAGAKPVQSIAYLHQGFNYGDCGLRQSRIPTYEEFRNQNILALILGANGLLHYNRSELQYPELYIGIPALIAEQKIIGNEAVIHPQGAISPKANNNNLRLLGKANPDGSFWLLACNAAEETAEYEITWSPLGNNKIQILSEDSRIQATDGRFRDRFTPFQARIYTTSTATFNLQKITAINTAIEEEYARRVKPGNLIYQRFEEERVLVRASSNKFSRGRDDNCLWHVTDGICSGLVARNGHSNGVITFCDATPKQSPDWLEIEFPSPQTVSRVVLYPVDNSLLDYEIQAKQKDSWVTLAAVKAADGAEQTVSFPGISLQVLRLMVTATRGSETRLYEIEVYEQ